MTSSSPVITKIKHQQQHMLTISYKSFIRTFITRGSGTKVDRVCKLLTLCILLPLPTYSFKLLSFTQHQTGQTG